LTLTLWAKNWGIHIVFDFANCLRSFGTSRQQL
jgi:hypothetical protein